MNKPKLRFKNFHKEWEKKKLSEVVELFGGYAFLSKDAVKTGVKWLKIANVDLGKIKWNVSEYLPIEFLKHHSKYEIFEGDIVLTLTRPIIGKKLKIAEVTLNDTPALLNQRVAKVEIINNLLDKRFIYQLLQNHKTVLKLENAISGTDPPNLGNKELKKIDVFIPTKIESEKIAKFLSLLDKKIQLQQEKFDLLKEQKKGYMQKIISQELRFKNEQGDDFPEWKTYIKADELFCSVSNKNHNGDYPVLSATQDNGMVYRDTLERHMTFNDNNLKSYKLVEEEDFVISLRSFQGGIEFSKLQGLVSPAYTVIRKKDESVYNPYFANVFKTDNFITRLNTTTYGIRDGKAISYKDFSTLTFDVPSVEEQKKIAKFLDLQKRKIYIEEKKLRELQNRKKAFMQQMFI